MTPSWRAACARRCFPGRRRPSRAASWRSWAQADVPLDGVSSQPRASRASSGAGKGPPWVCFGSAAAPNHHPLRPCCTPFSRPRPRSTVIGATSLGYVAVHSDGCVQQHRPQHAKGTVTMALPRRCFLISRWQTNQAGPISSQQRRAKIHPQSRGWQRRKHVVFSGWTNVSGGDCVVVRVL